MVLPFSLLFFEMLKFMLMFMLKTIAVTFTFLKNPLLCSKTLFLKTHYAKKNQFLLVSLILMRYYGLVVNQLHQL